jgi:signal transduction histidine kinase
VRVAFVILLLVTSLFGEYIKGIYIAEHRDGVDFGNVDSLEFVPAKLPLIKQSNSHQWIKVTVDKSKYNPDLEYVLKADSRLGINVFEYDTKKYFLEPNIYELNTTKKDIYIKVYNLYGLIYTDTKIYTKKEYVDTMMMRNNLYGIAYGIIFSAFLYYLAFFIYNKRGVYILYSLTQLSLFFLVYYSKQNAITTKYDYHISDFSLLAFVIFSALFTREFLSTKEHAPIIDKLLLIMVPLYTVGFMIYKYTGLYTTSIIPLILYLVAGVVVYTRTKSKPIIFYLIGWSVIISSMLISEFELYLRVIGDFDSYIELEDLIHITSPFESIILAFALSYKMKILEEKREKNRRMLIQQNKLSAMGEMIANIAHQWRQPLTHLNYIIMNINTAYKYDKLSKEYMQTKSKEAEAQLQYMSNTIDDFRNFYSPQQDKERFDIKESIQSAIIITGAALKDAKIEIDTDLQSAYIVGYKRELAQVVLNLITNAKDALINNNIKEPTISISAKDNIITIEDNAGGIDDKIQEQIFEPFFTTKEGGTGLGLYMLKTIIQEHFDSKVEYKKVEDKSIFTIILKKE